MLHEQIFFFAGFCEFTVVMKLMKMVASLGQLPSRLGHSVTQTAIKPGSPGRPAQHGLLLELDQAPYVSEIAGGEIFTGSWISI